MKKVIFIMGSGHCGSTLLDLILGSHSEAFSLGEFQTISQKIKSAQFPNNLCDICSGTCEFWNNKSSLPALNSYFNQNNGRLSRLYNYFTTNIYKHIFDWTGANILIDSSKMPWWIRRQLRPFWFWHKITPYLIYLYRDGRAVVNSYLRKYPVKGVAYFAQKWADETLFMERYFQSFPEDRRLKIFYEELAANPEVVIKDTCQTIGITYEQNMLYYWQKQHHMIVGNAGTRFLIYKYREQFGSNLAERWTKINQETQEFDQVFYDQLGLAIKPDMRWQHELSQEQLKTFDSVAGKVNQAYSYYQF